MVRKFLIILSGARPEILDQCPTERFKFQSLGWSILISGAIATVSMWFVLTSGLSRNPVLTFLGILLCGLIIIGIYRWLVTSMPADSSHRLAVAMPRVIVAVLLGTIGSTPLVLRIFQPEISTQIIMIKQQQAKAFVAAQQDSAVGQQVTKWRSDVNSLEQVISSDGNVQFNTLADPQIQSLTKQRTAEVALKQQYYQEWQCQLYGGTGCRVHPNGPLASASHDSYNQAAAQISELTSQIQQRENELSNNNTASARARHEQAASALPGAQKQLNAAMALEEVQLNDFEAQNNAASGLLIDLQALNELSDKNSTLNATRLLLFLLFLMIDTLPIMIKLVQKPGNYEILLRAASERELEDARRVLRTPLITAGAPFLSYAHDVDADKIRRRPRTRVMKVLHWTSAAEKASRDRSDEPDREATLDQAGSGQKDVPVVAGQAEATIDRDDSSPKSAAPEKLPGHAFISYVREDSHHVDRLQRRLEEAGVRVWRDTADLWPGEDWRAKIRQAIIDDALVFIACFSQQSLARAKSYQNEELTLAIEQLRRRAPDDPWLIPVRLDDCEIPNRDIGAGRTLTSIQRADLFGDRADEGVARLVAAVLRILGRGEPPQRRHP
jgi:hypothetical protein